MTTAALGLLALALLAAAPAAAGSFEFPNGGEYLAGTQTVSFTRELGGNSVVNLKLFVSGAEIKPELCDNCAGTTFVLDTTAYGDSREYFLELRENSAGGGGNVRVTTSGTFTIDNKAPATAAVLDGPVGAAGYYAGDVTIELVADDETAGVASTSYRVDAGTFAPFTTYSGSFRVSGDGSHVIQFRSVDRAGNVETLRNVTFDIDATAPDTGSAIAGTAGSNGWLTGPVTTTLTASDATSGVAETLASMDGGVWAAVTAPIVVSDDGAHSIRFYSTDAAGNVEATDSVSFRIDATAPETQATVLGHMGLEGWHTSEVIVELAAADATSGVAGAFVSFGGPVVPYTGSLRVAEDGQHTLSFYSVDAAGNTETVQTVTFRIDTTDPDTGSAISGVLGDIGWFTGPVTTTLTPSDATSGVSSTFASIDDGPWFITGLTPVVSSDGSHTIRFYGTDAAGNVEATDSVSFRIDATSPETTRDVAGHAGTNGWHLEDVTFTLAARDLTSGVRGTDFDLDGTGFEAYGGSVRVTGEGAHGIAFRATDLAGNVEGTKAFSVNIDTVAPVSAVTVGEPSTEAGRVVYVTSATPITLDANDATSGVDRIEFRLNEGGFEAYAGEIHVLGEDGEYRLEWRAVDEAGNVETAQFLRLFLDNTAPGLSLDRPQPGGLYVDGVLVVETHPLLVETAGPALGNAATVVDTIDFAVATGALEVRVTAVDAAVGTQEVRFFVDGVLRATDSEAPYAWTWDTTLETLGEHVLAVEAEDLLGNEDGRSLRVFTVPTAQEGLEKTLDGIQAGTDPVLPEEVRDILAQFPAPPEPPAPPPLPTEPPALPPLPEPPALPPLPV